MDLATPLPKWEPASAVERRQMADKMIETVQKLHTTKHMIHGDVKLDNMLVDAHGHVRLCDFEEVRFKDEDEDAWDGSMTWHYASPDRWRMEVEMDRIPPPTKVDDLYGLGLSIWELYTGVMPLEDLAQDDVELRERLPKGETVDVMAVDDVEVREVIKGLIRHGGAQV